MEIWKSLCDVDTGKVSFWYRLSIRSGQEQNKSSERVDFETKDKTTSQSMTLNTIAIDLGPSHYI